MLWRSATQEVIRLSEIREMHSMETVKHMLDFHPEECELFVSYQRECTLLFLRMAIQQNIFIVNYSPDSS